MVSMHWKEIIILQGGDMHGTQTLSGSKCFIVICGIIDNTEEKAMATHSSTLAWEIPWTEEPGRLQSMGLEELGHDLATKPLPPYVCIYA